MQLNQIQPTLFERAEIRFWMTSVQLVDLIRLIKQLLVQGRFNVFTVGSICLGLVIGISLGYTLAAFLLP